MQEIILKGRYFERGLSKSLKKVTFFFLSNPVPFNGQKGPGTSDQWQVQKHSFISYVLPDQVWWWNIKWFLSYSENYISKFMQVNLWHHKLFHFHLPVWIWKVWKGRGKITKVWISQERKKLFRRNKKHFSKQKFDKK